ncbi:hypothetical protein GCM10023322_32810 [Rugosimonospora acidiphila]|uniref:Chitin-binding type-3 domain-containing protein n=1 Tax=Rugosimonospora acidiphila TaxID=556531 RepID=A0ABP9RUW4_9ACTN
MNRTIRGSSWPRHPSAAWTAMTVCNTGDQMSHCGKVYEAKSWTRNQAPGHPNGPSKSIS